LNILRRRKRKKERRLDNEYSYVYCYKLELKDTVYTRNEQIKDEYLILKDKVRQFS